MKKMPTNYHTKDGNYPYPEAKRTKTTTTENVYQRCYDCGEQFNPMGKGQKFCAKCFKDRSSVNSKAVDHNHLRKRKEAVAPTYSKLVPEYQPSISSVVVVPNSSKLIDLPEMTNSNIANQHPEDGLTKLKVKVVDHQVKMEATSPTAKDAARSLSGILLAEIDLSSSSDESNNDKKEQGTHMENVTSSQTPTCKVISDNTCSNSHLLIKKSNIPPVTLLLKSSSNSKEKSIELQDNSDLSIQNIVPDIPNNHKLDSSQLELEDLRIKEEELKQMIKSCALDKNEISAVKKRIIELESKLDSEKEILLSKEDVVKTYELEVLKAQSVVEVLTEDKDSLCNQVKKTSADLEFLRSSCKSAETLVNEYQKKLKDVEDESLSDYLITILAKKQQRVKAAEDKVKKAISKMEDAENLLNKINEDFQKKEAVHREMLVKSNQVKSELMELRDFHACTEKENKVAQSQMKSLMETNNQERQQKYFELKSQLVEIQKEIESKECKRLLEIKYDAIRKELDTERESISRLLSL